MHRMLVVLLAFTIPGCLDAGTSDTNDVLSPTLVRTILSTVAVATCPTNCWEPTIAADPQGRIFVVTADDRLVVSEDGGATFTQLATPPLPPGAAGRGDEQVDVGTDGRLYFSALIGNGIQIAASKDGGKTWEQDVTIRINPGGGHAVESDRQWLAFGPGGTVYLAFQRPIFVGGPPPVGGFYTSQLVVGRSDDGGRTFGPLRELHTGGTIVGQPVVANDGTLFVPHFYYPTVPSEPLNLRVAVSKDKGVTFQMKNVPSRGNSPGAWFPTPAVRDDGRLFLTWADGQNGRLLSWSDDQGTTWAPRVVLTDGDEIGISSPWMVLDPDGTPHITFHVAEDGTRSTTRLVYATFQNGTLDKTVVANGITGVYGVSSNTHMAHMAVDAGGDPVWVWSSSAEQKAWVGKAVAASP